jgi:hypothetical protein
MTLARQFVATLSGNRLWAVSAAHDATGGYARDEHDQPLAEMSNERPGGLDALTVDDVHRGPQGP